MLTLPTPLADGQPMLRLVLPAATWQALPGLAAGAGFTLAHGPLVLQPVDGALLALVPRLVPGPPRALPPDGLPHLPHLPGPHGPLPSAPNPAPTAPTALALVVRAAAGSAPLPGPPAGVAGADAAAWAEAAAHWDHWLARHAPEHRLAARARVADLLLLWCDARGPAWAALRRGDAWARLAHHAPWALPPAQAASGVYPPWVPVQQLDLAGAGLRRLALPARQAEVALAGAAPADESRHSRQALALTPAVLQGLQRQRVGIVGAGLEGAAIASSLVRLGVDVCVLDPADTMAQHLQADLAPWCEGQPRVQALRRQLQGLPTPGALLDGRRLPAGSAAAGSLLAACDVIVTTGDGPAHAQAEAWALSLLKPLLAIHTRVAGPPDVADAQAWIALLPPGTACLRCIGRWPTLPDAQDLPAVGDGAATPALRSWSVLAANLALRLLEHLAAGRVETALLRHLHNDPLGGLQVRDWRMPDGPGRPICPRCTALAGAGLRVAAQAAAGVAPALPDAAD